MYHRKSIRLPQYNYSSPGMYFITICTHNRRCLFGDVVNNKMILNHVGEMITAWWQKMFAKYKTIQINEYIIMPNHIHGIIQIIDKSPVGADPCIRPKNIYQKYINPDKNRTNPPNGGYMGNIPNKGEYMDSPLRVPIKKPNLGQYIAWFKRMTTNEYIRNVKNDNWPPFNNRLWQRNYYEHIIRNAIDLNNIREYIINNLINWQYF